MKTRVISGLIMLPLLAVVFINGYVLYAATFIIALMAVKEFYNGFKAMGIRASYPVAVVATVCLFVIGVANDVWLRAGNEMSSGWFVLFDKTGYKLYLMWFFGCILVCLLYMFRVKDIKMEDAMATLVGIFYIVFFSFHIALISQDSMMNIMVWFVIISAFGTDIMAYFSGYLFGKHKLCPNISPKKTIEGAIGGTLGSVILCVAFGYLFARDIAVWTDSDLVHYIVIGLLGGIVSQLGDLTASVFKRRMGIKDYGNLIPGHGGILDRFDSVLFTGPLVYYYTVFVLYGGQSFFFY
ncbi:MAG: phosphatidate cytidylyltransferase [Lentihominibacter sp.]|jgi:phosphatidate cytidylyltransferase